MKAIVITCLMILLAMHVFSQSNATKGNMNNDFYPFEITETDGAYSIVVQIESAELFAKYNPIFDRNGYSGNGYCWEGHITQILEKIDKGLLKHIDFDPEAGAFFAYADSRSAQQRFVDILSPIFIDLKKLEEYIKSAKRNRIDD
jgi:hypothetical protein